MTIPTSKAQIVYGLTNIEMYNQASPTTKTNMETYGLVPPNMIRNPSQKHSSK